jgi:hypothetical protein
MIYDIQNQSHLLQPVSCNYFTALRYDIFSPFTAIRSNLNEATNYLQLIEWRKKQKDRNPHYDMCVIPVNFSTSEKRNMLLNLKELVMSR